MDNLQVAYKAAGRLAVGKVVEGAVVVRIGFVGDKVNVPSPRISNITLEIVVYLPTSKCPLGIGTLR